ncbi:MAG: hypothetical protein H7Z38_21940, partial [Rubrivivax sp.]|nr:hypothetical protein [Pyrinomonadaceae bacterium]
MFNREGIRYDEHESFHQLKQSQISAVPISAKSIESDIKTLRDEILRHEELYHVHDRPEISDVEYDALVERLRLLEDENPEYRTPDSPTMRVGGRPAVGFEQHVHRRPMLSLENSYNIEDLR